MARKMKDSGIEWIGEIPEEWEVARIKDIVEQSKDGIKIGPFGSALTNKTFSDAPYNVYSQANLISGDYSTTKNTVSLDIFNNLSSYEVFSGDICLSMMGTIGKCKVVPNGITRGIMDSHLIKIRLSPKVSNSFFEYVYDKDLGGICFAQMQLDKKGFIMDGLNTSIVKNLKFPLPSISEQLKITAYLDIECSSINMLLSKTRSSIEEYKKLKQAVITQAVTKGVRGEREMKDSGVEWIGEIPVTHSIYKLKYLLRTPLKYGANESGVPYSDNLPRYIRITDITPDGNLKDTGKLSLSKESAKDYILEDGDILFARSGATVGKSFIYHQSYGRSAYAGYLIKASLNDNVFPKFVYYYTCSSLYETWKNSIFIQSTIQNIGADRYANLPIPVPNTLQEQKEIADYLDAKCAEIDKLIAKKEQLVKELEAYKKSLIYEVVTGKREV